MSTATIQINLDVNEEDGTATIDATFQSNTSVEPIKEIQRLLFVMARDSFDALFNDNWSGDMEAMMQTVLSEKRDITLRGMLKGIDPADLAHQMARKVMMDLGVPKEMLDRFDEDRENRQEDSKPSLLENFTMPNLEEDAQTPIPPEFLDFFNKKDEDES